MVDQFNLAQITDIGFVALVVATCYHALFKGQGEGNGRRWKDELKKVEEVLRELIDEASAASSNFDRALGKRKVEIEQLIKHSEEIEAKLAQLEQRALTPAPTPAPAPKKAAPTKRAEPLPNDTWDHIPLRDEVVEEEAPFSLGAEETLPPRRPRTQAPSTPRPRMTAEAADEATRQRRTVETDLLALIAAGTEDKVSISRERTTAPAPARELSPPSRAAQAPSSPLLNEQIEVSADEAMPPSLVARNFDVATFRIARRLLLAGKEIHIVARKLDIPISEIRMIDRAIRGESEVDEFDSPEVVDTNGFGVFERNTTIL